MTSACQAPEEFLFAMSTLLEQREKIFWNASTGWRLVRTLSGQRENKKTVQSIDGICMAEKWMDYKYWKGEENWLSTHGMIIKTYRGSY